AYIGASKIEYQVCQIEGKDRRRAVTARRGDVTIHPCLYAPPLGIALPRVPDRDWCGSLNGRDTNQFLHRREFPHKSVTRCRHEWKSRRVALANAEYRIDCSGSAERQDWLTGKLRKLLVYQLPDLRRVDF